jgi:hypothetical protein
VASVDLAAAAVELVAAVAGKELVAVAVERAN